MKPFSKKTILSIFIKQREFYKPLFRFPLYLGFRYIFRFYRNDEIAWEQCCRVTITEKWVFFLKFLLLYDNNKHLGKKKINFFISGLKSIMLNLNSYYRYSYWHLEIYRSRNVSLILWIKIIMLGCQKLRSLAHYIDNLVNCDFSS